MFDVRRYRKVRFLDARVQIFHVSRDKTQLIAGSFDCALRLASLMIHDVDARPAFRPDYCFPGKNFGLPGLSGVAGLASS